MADPGYAGSPAFKIRFAVNGEGGPGEGESDNVPVTTWIQPGLLRLNRLTGGDVGGKESLQALS